MAKVKPIYRVRLVVDKFYPEYEGQHLWNWSKETLRTVSVAESGELRDILKDHGVIADALLAGRRHPVNYGNE